MFIRNLILLVLFFCVVLVYGQDSDASKRNVMVTKQLKERGITDRAVLKAMSTVPRHLFVPQAIKEYAYADSALPIGNEQTISQPYIVAFMTQELKLKPGDKVLEIGTGSGYQAAVLSAMGNTVYTIEIIEALGLEAKERLKQLKYHTVNVRIDDGYNGWPEEAPFDAIMVTAGAKDIPQPLIDQLAEGGRMMIPIGASSRSQQLVLVTKKKGKIQTEKRLAVRFVPFTRKD